MHTPIAGHMLKHNGKYGILQIKSRCVSQGKGDKLVTHRGACGHKEEACRFSTLENAQDYAEELAKLNADSRISFTPSYAVFLFPRTSAQTRQVISSQTKWIDN